MIITLISLFPNIFKQILAISIIGRAQKKGLVRFNFIDLRDFSKDAYHSVDDRPYGGGVGMILRVDIVEPAINKARKLFKLGRQKVILTDPKGQVLTQKKARDISTYDHLIIVCGHYEGFDDRINFFVDERISIGKYILTGGEIPAMVITDALVRLIPGVLSKKEATIDESFSYKNILEPPRYTRPPEYKGYRVPKVLLSGNHAKITAWKKSAISLK